MPYLYMESSPQLKGRARQYGRHYRKMAVVEVEPGYGPDRPPKMISPRARGVVRVVDCATLHVGTTDRSAGRVWRSRMLALCAELNAAESDTLHGPACRRPSCTGRGTVMGWASGWRAIDAGINWENSALHCDHCNRRIEPAYGTVEDAED